MNSQYVSVPLPYPDMGLEDEDHPSLALVIDPASEGASMYGELQWIMSNASADETRRILHGAGLLLAMDAGTIGECLRTAIIWERG